MFLNHPNIAKLYACFHDQHHIYLVSEYATSGNLYDLIKQPKNNRRKSEEAVKLVGQMCEAVRYIHLHHVIHRDIKP
jgi:serine/threonine protein kinase